METDEVVEALQVRENESMGSDLTRRHDHRVDVGPKEMDDPASYPGTLTIEYKPDQVVLGDGSFYRLIESGFIPAIRERAIEPEEFVETLYFALVEVIFPGEERLDDPWDYVPLVVELEYGDTSESNRWYVSLGSYR